MLKRRVGETLMIGDKVTVTDLEIKGNQMVEFSLLTAATRWLIRSKSD